jgi:RimJ/RimL family protein N-acetyltransferase
MLPLVTPSYSKAGGFLITARELLRLHLEAGWSLTLPALDQATHDFVVTHGLPLWSLYLATMAREQVAIWRPEIGPEQRLQLRAQAHGAGLVWDQALKMRREVVSQAPFISSQQEGQARQRARELNAGDAGLINTFEAESAPYFLNPHMAPCVGVVVEGQLMSIAHSSRQTPVACALGINTVPEARRRGYATAATILWTALVQQKGLVPIYSAFAWNTASLRLAQSIGYIPCIDGVYGPVPEAGE